MQDDALRKAAEALVEHAQPFDRTILDTVKNAWIISSKDHNALEAALNAPRDTPSTMTVEELQQFLWENDTGYDPLDPRATQIVAMYRQQAEALHPLLTPSTVQVDRGALNEIIVKYSGDLGPRAEDDKPQTPNAKG